MVGIFYAYKTFTHFNITDVITMWVAIFAIKNILVIENT